MITGQELVQQTVNALSLGSTYALLALGFAMVFSIVRVVNFAHGELVTVAAYALYFTGKAGLPFAVQVPCSIVTAAAVAVLMERFAFRPLRGSSFLTLLFAAFAVSVVIQNGLLIGVSARPKGIPLPSFFNDTLHIGSITIGWLQIITAVTCLGALGLLTVFLRRSVQGLAMLAASEDFEMTRMMGLRANRVVATAFVISGVLAGVAAIFIVARRGAADPTMGDLPLLKAFIASVLGGLDSLGGAVVGGFVLAGVEVLLQVVLPSDLLAFSDAFALIVVVIILYFRPEGILAPRVEPS